MRTERITYNGERYELDASERIPAPKFTRAKQRQYALLVRQYRALMRNWQELWRGSGYLSKELSDAITAIELAIETTRPTIEQAFKIKSESESANCAARKVCGL
jgi:hypothetical protein